MSLRKIAYLTPLYFDEESYLGGGERYPLNLGKGVVESSAGQYEVDLMDTDPDNIPYRLREFSVLGQGHNYDAQVAAIEIVGE